MNQSPHNPKGFSARGDVLFIVGACAIFLILFALGRTILMARNSVLLAEIPWLDLLRAYGIGLRFDLIISSYALLPLVLAMFLPDGLGHRRKWHLWLGFWVALFSFQIVLEPDFYREFHTRLNSLVFQYIKEDPITVMNMLWYGFPVLAWLSLGGVLATAAIYTLRYLDKRTRLPARPLPYAGRAVLALLLVCVTVISARGTLRGGAPLRWGDAYHSNHVFASHLALNGAFTLSKAAIHEAQASSGNHWLTAMPDEQALSTVRGHWLAPGDQLTNGDDYPLLRLSRVNSRAGEPRFTNVVLIIMESFSARFVGALTKTRPEAGPESGPVGENITPYFDELSKQGLLFDHMFSNGTHTHQGMFATMACFPNLPRYEYLMQQAEGMGQFSGLAKVLTDRDYHSLYLYNGDFSWDNQGGFFRAQGLRNLIGRDDYINPRFQDRTWGVSDEDVFERAFEELLQLERKGQAYFATIQTLTNHSPFSLPEPLPVKPIYDGDSLDKRFTAMRYSDYALGRFFERVQSQVEFDDSLFVIIGDHGFPGAKQISEIDLWRFHIPMLLLGRGLREHFGPLRHTTGTQVDVVPTILGRLGRDYEHHCWGRDLLALPENDPGIGVIKPSGNDQTVAMLKGERILIVRPDAGTSLYDYRLYPEMRVTPLRDAGESELMENMLKAYVQTATRALLHDRVGHLARTDRTQGEAERDVPTPR